MPQTEFDFLVTIEVQNHGLLLYLNLKTNFKKSGI